MRHLALLGAEQKVRRRRRARTWCLRMDYFCKEVTYIAATFRCFSFCMFSADCLLPPCPGVFLSRYTTHFATFAAYNFLATVPYIGHAHASRCRVTPVSFSITFPLPPTDLSTQPWWLIHWWLIHSCRSWPFSVSAQTSCPLFRYGSAAAV